MSGAASRSRGFAVSISAIDNASKTLDAVNRRIAALSAPMERFNRSVDKFGEVTGVSRLTEGFRRLSSSTLDTFRSLDRIVAPLGVITGAASLAGMATMVQRWGEFGTRVQQAAYRLSVPADRLTKLEAGARLAGSSAEALDAGLRSLGDRLSGAAWGRDPQAVQLFQSLGVAFRDAKGNARQADDALGDVAEAIKRMPDPRTQARITRELFGGEELLPFLRRGREGIAEWTREVERLGGFITPAMAERADKLRTSFSEISVAVEGVGNRIADKLAPRVTELNDRLATWIARNKDLIATKVGEWIDGFVDRLERFSAWTERHPQLAGFILGAAIGGRVAGPWGAVVGGAVMGAPGYTPFGPGEPAGPAEAPEHMRERLEHEQADELRRTGGWPDSPGGRFLRWMFGPLRVPGTRAARLATPPGTGTAAAATAQHAHDFFRARGLTEEQTAGILARINRESAFDPTRWGDENTSYGLFQHHAERLAAMQRRYGTAIPSEQQQLEYAWWEMTEGPEQAAGQAVRASRTSEQSAIAFTGGFERPRDADGEATQTAREAARYIGLYDAPQQSDGHVQVDVRLHGAPPGTTAQVASSGPVSAPPPRIETSLPGVR